MEQLRPNWHAEAKCLGTGFENFFPDDEGDIFASIATTTRGRKVCQTCEAFAECLYSSLANKEKFGIWAGVSARQRKKHLAAIERGEKTIAQVMGQIMGGGTDDEPRRRADSAQRRAG